MIHKDTGEVLWTDDIGNHAWSSPIVSDDQVIVANCKGEVRVYSQNKTKELLFTKKIKTGACIESTPALWNGALYFGARDGFFYKIQ
jgi:outer membrane protein assembly factor BamB